MAAIEGSGDVSVEHDGFVALVEIHRPPHNYFDRTLIEDLATVLEALDQADDCRVVVLCSEGRSFCAGADFGPGDDERLERGQRARGLYGEALRLFRTQKPIVAAVQGAAVGGGLGLVMVADLRVACPEARFVANFTRLGFHPGFGLTVTLPETIGTTKSALMLYTGRRIKGEAAFAIGLADLLVPQDEVRRQAVALAREIAECSPLGVVATRATIRQGLADRVEAAIGHELEEQTRLRATDDFAEGVRAMAERRVPDFQSR